MNVSPTSIRSWLRSIASLMILCFVLVGCSKGDEDVFVPFPAKKSPADANAWEILNPEACKEARVSFEGKKILTQNNFDAVFDCANFDGELDSRNEFEQRMLIGDESWFGRTFLPIGRGSNSSIAGVNAGESGEMNLLFGSMHYRRNRFLAGISLKTSLALFNQNLVKIRPISAIGDGFIFAFGVNLLQLELAFNVERKDAVQQTFDRSIEHLTGYILSEMKKLPFRTRVEMVDSREGIIINAGRREGIVQGDVFYHLSDGELTKMVVSEAFYIGSILKPENENLDVFAGDVVVLDEYASELQFHNQQLKEVKDSSKRKQLKAEWEQRRSTITRIDLQKIYDNRRNPINDDIIDDSAEIVFNGTEGSFSDDLEEILSQKDSIISETLRRRYLSYDQPLQENLAVQPVRNRTQKLQAWNLARLQLASVANQYNGSGINVAIIDSGVDYNHPALHERFSREYAGYDYFSFDPRPFDDNSHGTAIAGIIAAKGVGNEPIGIAPAVRLASYKVFSPIGETTSGAMLKAFTDAINDGAKIIVCGWATRKRSQAMQDALTLAAAKNVLVVTGVGDEGEDIDRLSYYPAAYREYTNLIRVASTNQANLISTKRYRYSNFGAATTDIAAPGEAIQTIAPRNQIYERDGSDLAAAHVAGVAALLMQKHPNWSAVEIREEILRKAVSVPTLQGKVAGARLLNAKQALQ